MSSDLHFAEAVRLISSLNDMCRDDNVSGYMTLSVINSYKSLIMSEIDRMVNANNHNVNDAGFRELARFREETTRLGQAITTGSVAIRRPRYHNESETERLGQAIFTGHVGLRTFRRQNEPEPVQFSQSEMITEPSEPIRYNPLEKTVVVTKKKLEESCPSMCTICQETPKYKDAVYTECEHYYCKCCWSNWMNAIGSNKNCPTCRKNTPKTISYRARNSRVANKPASERLRPIAPIQGQSSSSMIDDDDYENYFG